MRKNIIYLLTSAVLLAGCEKKSPLDQNQYWEFKPGNTNIKFINTFAGLNPSAGTTPNGPSVDLFINNVKINAGVVSYSGLFPAVSGQYASLAPGSMAIKAVINRATPLATDVLVNGNFSLDAGKYYSAFLVDTVPIQSPANPNIAIIEDDATRAKSGFYKMRFAHMIPTADTLEIVSKNDQKVLITDIVYKKASGFIELPLLSKNDTIQLRKKGTTTVLTDQRPFFPSSERLYTFVCRGVYTATTGTRPRTLTTYINQ